MQLLQPLCGDPGAPCCSENLLRTRDVTGMTLQQRTAQSARWLAAAQPRHGHRRRKRSCHTGTSACTYSQHAFKTDMCSCMHAECWPKELDCRRGASPQSGACAGQQQRGPVCGPVCAGLLRQRWLLQAHALGTSLCWAASRALGQVDQGCSHAQCPLRLAGTSPHSCSGTRPALNFTTACICWSASGAGMVCPMTVQPPSQPRSC